MHQHAFFIMDMTVARNLVITANFCWPKFFYFRPVAELGEAHVGFIIEESAQ